MGTFALPNLRQRFKIDLYPGGHGLGASWHDTDGNGLAHMAHLVDREHRLHR